MAEGDHVAAEAVAGLASELADAVRRLHAAETELLWPVLSAYLVAMEADVQATDVQRLAEQSKRLVALAAEIVPVVARLRSEATATDRDVLADLFLAVRAELADHFGDKERTVLPLAGRYMTEAQWREIGRQFLCGVSNQRRVFRMGAMLLECSRRDRSRVVRACDGNRGRIAMGRVRRAFVREFGRIQDVLGQEPAMVCPLRLTAAG
jgi:hypothetical protein